MAYERKAVENETKPAPVVKQKPQRFVWQSPKGPNCKITLVTLHEVDLPSGRMVAYAEVKPNHVGQYVLDHMATKLSNQIEAMERYAEKYGLYTVDPKMEGVMPTSYEGMAVTENATEVVTSLQAELEKARRANAELMKKLADGGNDAIQA